jgi:hypothetical protein
MEKLVIPIRIYPMVFISRFKTLLMYKIKEYGKRIYCIWEKEI